MTEGLFVCPVLPNLEAKTKEGKALAGVSLRKFLIQKSHIEKKHICALDCCRISGLFSSVSASAALCQGVFFLCYVLFIPIAEVL